MVAKKINRWDLLPAANKGIRATNVSSNRRASDRYHSPGFKDLNPLSGGRSRGGTGKRVMRLLRRSNNGNIPGHGVGGVPGGGLGGGIPSFGLKHILKNHKAMHSAGGSFNIPGGGGGAVKAPKLVAKPMFQKAKPFPVRKLSNTLNPKQPKPMTTAPLAPLKSATTTRPKFAGGR